MTQSYVAGQCNIGPAEIARRRLIGHLGAAATVAGLLALVALRLPAAWRLLLFFPASASASGYVQAASRFCAGYGSRGVYNFGPVGSPQAVRDPADAARDRARSNRIGLTSAAIGAAVAILAWLLPL